MTQHRMMTSMAIANLFIIGIFVRSGSGEAQPRPAARDLVSTLAQAPPPDFALRFEFGTCTTDVLDTFKNVFVRNMDPKPSISVSVSLSPDTMKTIYHAIVDSRFFEYPEEFTPRTDIWVAPAEGYRLFVRSGGLSHQVHWRDNARASNDEAVRLRTLFRRIRQLAFELPEVARLPQSPAICL